MILWSESTGLYSTTVIQTTLTSTSQLADNLSLSLFRTAKYLIQATQGTNYQALELLVIHNNTTVDLMQYGSISTGTARIVTPSVSIVSGAMQLTLARQDTSSTVDVIFSRQIIRFPVTTTISTTL